MREYLFPVIVKRPDVTIVAGGRANGKSGREQFGPFSVPIIPDLLERLEELEIDYIVAATNANNHEQILSQCIGSGINCFVEKPPAPSSDGVLRLCNQLKASPSVIAVGMNFRYASPVWKIIDVANEMIGENDRLVKIAFRADVRQRLQSETYGQHLRAFLLEFGIHPIDLAINVFAGGAAKISSMRASVSGDFISLELEPVSRGPLIYLELQNAPGGFHNTIEISSSNGSAVILTNLSRISVCDPRQILFPDKIFGGNAAHSYEWPMRRCSLARNGYAGCLDAFFDASGYATLDSMTAVYNVVDAILFEACQ